MGDGRVARDFWEGALSWLILIGVLGTLFAGVEWLVGLSEPASPSGVVCNDGWVSDNVGGGPGTCSHHGGIRD